MLTFYTVLLMLENTVMIKICCLDLLKPVQIPPNKQPEGNIILAAAMTSHHCQRLLCHPI